MHGPRHTLLGYCGITCGGPPLVNLANGEVQTAPKLYVIFWGSNWLNGGSTKTTLELFYNSLLSTGPFGEWGGILTQYCGTNGCPPRYASSVEYWVDGGVTHPERVCDSFEEECEVGNASIHGEIHRAITLPGSAWQSAGADPNAQFIVIPAPHTTYQQNFAYYYNKKKQKWLLAFCGYHGDYASATYTFVPDLADTEGAFYPCKGSSDPTGGDATTATASHEYAETVTDPRLNAWLSKYLSQPEDPQEEEPEYTEIADLCTSGDDQFHSTGIWVQGLWDNHLNACELYDSNPPPVVPTDPPDGASEITTQGATLNANVNPNGTQTHAYFEYGPTSAYGTRLPQGSDIYVGSGTESVLVTQPVSGLQPNKTYHFRTVVYNSWSGAIYGPDQTFTTLAAAPTVAVRSATHISETGATLRGTVNPNNMASTYRFEYGPTTSYGTSVPVPDGSAGSGYGAAAVSAVIHGLQSGSTYHYRVVATNAKGTSVSADQVLPTVPWVASKTSPVSISDPGTSNQWVYFVGRDSAIWEWGWNGSEWSLTRLGGQVKAGSGLAPDYIQSSGRKTVYYVDATTGTIAYWGWAPQGGWFSGNLGGHPVAANTTPNALYDANTDTTDVFYADASGELWYWEWTASGGWSNRAIGGHLASGSSPTTTSWIGASDAKSVYYVDSGGSIAYWAWAPGSGWKAGLLSARPARLGSTPSALYDPNTDTTEVYYEAQGTLWRWEWTEAEGWKNYELANSVSGSNIAIDWIQASDSKAAYYVDAYGALASWTWAPGGVWQAHSLGGDVAPATSPTVVYSPQPDTTDLYYASPGGEIWRLHWTEANEWEDGTVTDGVFAPAPMVKTVTARQVQATGATLEATVNPQGLDTHYSFEYDKTQYLPGEAGHGTTVPVPAQDVGAGTSPVTVTTSVSSLQPATRYHFRIVASNEGGTTAATEQWFFTPGPPTATTEAATAITGTSAKLNGTVNPEGAAATYQFEYGPTTAYGTSVPVPAGSAGSGISPLAESQTIAVQPESTYHFRITAISAEGTVHGEDRTFATSATRLNGMATTDPFNATNSAVSNFGTNWSALGWSAGAKPKGQDNTNGWGPSDAYPTINGAYFAPTLTDPGPGLAVIATMAASPGSEGRSFSLWLDLTNPVSSRSGYQLTFIREPSGNYEVQLWRWNNGSSLLRASKANYPFATGNSLALVRRGSSLAVWTNTGSGFTELLNVVDITWLSGKVAVEGTGNLTRLTNFKAGELLTPVTGMPAALEALPLNDSFATEESPLSFSGAFSALAWDNGTSGHNTGRVASNGWGPYDGAPTVNGAYWKRTSFVDTGAGDAVAVKVNHNPANATRYFSLWLNMPNPATERTGYQLRLTETSVPSIYELRLARWQSGTETLLASKSSYSVPIGSLVALTDNNGTLAAWAKTGTEYTQVISAADATFTSGFTGIEGSGTETRLANFLSGPLPPH